MAKRRISTTVDPELWEQARATQADSTDSSVVEKALLALIASLFIARRRLWLTFTPGENGQMQIGYGLLARGEDPRLAQEAAAVRDLLSKNFDTLSAETESRA